MNNCSSRWAETLSKKFLPGEDILSRTKKELERAGKEIIDLAVGDPVAGGFINQQLCEELIQVAKVDSNSSSIGRDTTILKLKEAIANFEKKYRRVEYSSDEILITPGVAGAFNVIHNALLNSGDEILTPDPAHYLSWPSTYLRLFQARPVGSRTEEGRNWEPDLEDLRRNITSKTKAIIIINPNNPTGAVYPEKTLKNIADIAAECNLPIISDEIYGLITYDGMEARSTASIAGEVPVIVLSSISKIFVALGWRVGYMAFHDPRGKIKDIFEVAQGVSYAYGHLVSGMPTPILAAAARVYSRPPTAGKEMVHQLQTRRDYAHKHLNEISGISCTKPNGGMFCFPHVHSMPEARTDEDFALRLLREQSILVNPGSYFGASGRRHFRTSLLPKLEVLENSYGRLEKFMRGL